MQHVPISRARYVQENRKMRFQKPTLAGARVV